MVFSEKKLLNKNIITIFENVSDRRVALKSESLEKMTVYTVKMSAFEKTALIIIDIFCISLLS